MPKLKLEKGKYYQSRDGSIYGPLLYSKKTKRFSDSVFGYVWDSSGKILASALFDLESVKYHDCDLIKAVRKSKIPYARFK